MEDMTEAEEVRAEPKCERRVCVYGYVRGNHMRAGSRVHVPGCGDLRVHGLAALPDPCPLPERPKHRSLNERERLLYAPMAGVGGMLYDRDAVYIELGGSHSHSNAAPGHSPAAAGARAAARRRRREGDEDEDEDADADAEDGGTTSQLVSGLRDARDGHTIDSQLEHAPLRLFTHTKPLTALPEQVESAVASRKKLISKGNKYM